MAKEEPSVGARLKNSFSFKKNYQIKPIGFEWRSHTLFIVATVGAGMFTDLFLYGLVVPILPFILRDHVGVPSDALQRYTSSLLAIYAIATLLLCPPAGWISDKLNSRQIPFLGGLIALMVATVVLFTGTTVPVLVIARVLQGASSAFVWSVGMALAMDTVGPEHQGKTIGTLFSICSVGEVFAPAAGGFLYQKAGELAVLALCMALLALDLVMRVCIIEKGTAARYIEAEESLNQQHASEQEEPGTEEATSTEETPLLPNGNDRAMQEEQEAKCYHIPVDQPGWIKKVPILYPFFHSSSLLLAYLITWGQAFLIAAYDATVPTHAAETYGFNAMEAGLLFVPMAVITLISGPMCGWLVDRYGAKWPTVAGYVWLTPFLVLLRLPKAKPYPQQVILWAALLGSLGVGISLGGSGSIVEAARIVDLYSKHNPGFFGEYGPYNQMCGIMSMFFNLGLSTGPILAGELKDTIGYGNMNAVLAGISVLIAVTSFIWLGGKPSFLKRKGAKPDMMVA